MTATTDTLAACDILDLGRCATPGPVIFTSAHSGRHYPPGWLAASPLDLQALRSSEDAFVDQLIESARDLAISVLSCQVARAYVDVNRDPWELDPALISDPLPAFARTRTPRVAAGLGVVPRVVAKRREIHTGKITMAEAEQRVSMVHKPWHAALVGMIETARVTHGYAVVVDWHSMPSIQSPSRAPGADIVLGDRHGRACARGLTRCLTRAFTAVGFSVAHNAPYAGGYTVETYGRPERGVHVVQVELGRWLYMDEATITPCDSFGAVKARLDRVIADVARTDWKAVLAA